MDEMIFIKFNNVLKAKLPRNIQIVAVQII